MRTKRRTCWAGLAAYAAALQVHAQHGPEAVSGAPEVPVLDSVVVQGAILRTALPQGTTVTSRHQLDERSIRNWEDFSKRAEPGVSFSRLNHSVNVRGLDADRVVTRVDGIRVPWLTDGARGVQGGLRAIDFNSLSSIDVVRGAGGVRAGTVDGLLELRTLSPDDLLGSGQDFGALVKSDHDGADRSWGGDAALAGRIGRDTSWLLQAGGRKGHELGNMGATGGYGALRDQPNPENTRQHNLMFKLQHDWNTVNRLSLAAESFRFRTDIDNMREQGPGESYEIGENATREQISRDRVVLGYDFRAAGPRSMVDKGELKLYWQRLRLESAQDGVRKKDERAFIIPGDPFGYGYPSGPYGRTNSIQESGFGLTTRWDGHIAGATEQRWMVGGDWLGSRTEQASAGYDDCPASPSRLPAIFGPRTCDFLHTDQSDMPRVQSRQWAVWAQDEFSWQEGRYALTPALRFDAYHHRPESGGAYADNPNAGLSEQSANRGQRLSPSLLASYMPRENLELYAKYGYGYKAPSATQLYMNYGAPGTYLRVGDPDLKPEISRGWELGVEAGDERRGGRLAFFDNRYRDFIDEGVPIGPDSPLWQEGWAGQYPMGITGYANRSRVRIYGVELSGRWSFTDHWYARGSLAWTHGRDQDTGDYLNSVPPLKALVALGYRTPGWGLEGLLTLAGSRRHVQYPEASESAPYPDARTPGYGVLDLTGYWKPEAVPGLRLQGGVYNVFDKKYWNALDVPTAGAAPLPLPIDAYTQPGRSLRVSLVYQY